MHCGEGAACVEWCFPVHARGSPLAHHFTNLPHHQRSQKRNRAWSRQHDNIVLQTASISTQPTCLPCPVSNGAGPMQRPLQKSQVQEASTKDLGWTQVTILEYASSREVFFQTTITIKKKLLTRAHLKIMCMVGRERREQGMGASKREGAEERR